MSIQVADETVKNWQEFVSLIASGFEGRWHFRGTLDDWDLQPSLERFSDYWGIRSNDIPNLERRLLREFKRSYPRTLSVPPPEDDDDLAWLAIMQHHGAPTRLLDFTYSAFVAAFFALDALLMSQDDQRSATVWALSCVPMENSVLRSMLSTPKKLQAAFDEFSVTRRGPAFRKVFMEASPGVPLVSPVNPWRLNERLVVQQGLFLCPGDVTRTFEDNLQFIPEATAPKNIRRIKLPRAILSEAFTNLARMNVTHATLFPGVDGYAKNLGHRINILRQMQLFDDTQY